MPKSTPVFKDLDGLAKSLKSDLFVRWMKRAQKQALIEWRDRTEAPGLAARFTEAGKSYYNFSNRVNKKRAPYVLSGALRKMLLQRKPQARRSDKTEVVTFLKFGGGALNFLDKIYGTRSTTTSLTTTVATVKSYQRGDANVTTTNGTFIRRGGTVQGYQINHVSKTIKKIKSPNSYAEEFAQFTKDGPWIAQRARALFALIARKSSVDRRTGGIKSTVLQELDQ